MVDGRHLNVFALTLGYSLKIDRLGFNFAGCQCRINLGRKESFPRKLSRVSLLSMPKHASQARNNGFTLLELLPASILLAVVSTACMKFLALDLEFHRITEHESRINQSLALALEHWSISAGEIVLCNLTPGKEWTVVDFVGESWIPEDADGHWICWKKVTSKSGPGISRTLCYRSNTMSKWVPWITLIDWEIVADEYWTTTYP